MKSQYVDELQQVQLFEGMKREEMANYLNATRSALSRVLTELKNEELVTYRKDLFMITNEAAMIERTE